ncbi:MAG: diacylglycerol kinase family protein [Patescibacteria group bacterium]
MYYYLYDSRLAEKKYGSTVAKIETRLTDLGINGKINHLSFLKNIQQVVGEELKRGVKTIVIVGDDKTFGQVINLIADFNVVVGFIPVEGKNDIARLLGIPEGEKACDVLSSRIIKKMDLGEINGYYFFTSLEVINHQVALECDNSYFINSEKKELAIKIANLDCYQEAPTQPDDNKLDIFLTGPKSTFFWKKNTDPPTHLKAKNIRITSFKSTPILLNDDGRIIKTPATITISHKKIKVIVGKNRLF